MNKKFTSLSPLKAIHVFCKGCMGGSVALVRKCETSICPNHVYRFGTGSRGNVSPLRIIRTYCFYCFGVELDRKITGPVKEAEDIKNCTDLDCPFYTYRFGKNPARKGMGNASHLPNRPHTQLNLA